MTGTVVDSTGAAVPGARIGIARTDGPSLQTVLSGAGGEFAFTDVSAGSYLVTVEAAGFAPFTTEAFTVTPPRLVLLPQIVLSIARVSSSIVVRPTEVIAAEQVAAEERQRLFGVFPNFYVSYVADAAPLTSKQKFSLAAHYTFDWTRFAGVSASAAIQQATDSYPGFGDGAGGYAKRWAAEFANDRSRELLGRYVFASLFHQDPRYFYQGTGTIRSRLGHALSFAVAARSDSGKLMPNYAYLLGNVSSSALSNVYYPHEDRGTRLILTNVALGLAGRAGQAVVQEFIGKRLTRHVPQRDSPATR